MAFRKRGFSGRFKRSFTPLRRTRSGWEISQTTVLAQFTVVAASTLEVPATLDLHLISQYGLARTGRDSAGGTTSTPVLDAGTRGVSVKWGVHNVTFGRMNFFSGSIGTIVGQGLPWALAVYKDEIDPNFIIDTTDILVPNHAGTLNLFATEVGGLNFLGSAISGTQGGPFNEVFGFPPRILHRDIGIKRTIGLDVGADIQSSATVLADSGQFVQRKFRTKAAFLGDAEGLFLRYQQTGFLDNDLNFSVFVQSVWCYKVRK